MEFGMRALTFCLAIAACGLAASAGSAHPKLVTSVPARDTAVAGPTVIKLQFSEAVIGRYSGVELDMTSKAGMMLVAPLKITAATAITNGSGRFISVKLAKPLPPGRYRVAWHAVSADTHRVAGSYAFTVK